MATYVVSPSTQSGVSDTRTHITRNFTLFAGGSVQVDYAVSSEADWDFFRIYITGATTFAASGEASGTATINTPSGGSIAIRLEYEKDGGVDEGTDSCRVDQIRIYNSSAVLQETHNFSGTPGDTPTGWTENLVDGGNDVVGSHWALVDTGGGGDFNLTPSLFTNTNTFYAATVSLVAAPSLFTNASTFHAPAASLVQSPSLFTNTSTFYEATADLVAGPTDFNLSPSLWVNEPAFYDQAATLSQTSSLYTNVSSFAAADLAMALEPAPLVNASVFYEHAASYEYVAPEAVSVAVRPSRTRALIRGEEYSAQVSSPRTRADVRSNNHSASVSGSRHTASISEG